MQAVKHTASYLIGQESKPGLLDSEVATTRLPNLVFFVGFCLGYLFQVNLI